MFEGEDIFRKVAKFDAFTELNRKNFISEHGSDD